MPLPFENPQDDTVGVLMISGDRSSCCRCDVDRHVALALPFPKETLQ